MEQNHKRCLLLNADFTPLSIISWQKAIIWSMRFNQESRYCIEIIDFYKNDYIKGVEKNHPIPAIARTQRFLKIHNKPVVFSRKNIYIRDNYTCQYCNKVYDVNELTYDHVIPKSKWTGKGSPTSWTNIVTACIGCNRTKRDKTPKQANMPLINFPIQPNRNAKYLHITRHLLSIRKEIPPEWLPYLPDSYL